MDTCPPKCAVLRRTSFPGSNTSRADERIPGHLLRLHRGTTATVRRLDREDPQPTAETQQDTSPEEFDHQGNRP